MRWRFSKRFAALVASMGEPASRAQRLAAFDVAAYDRLRVLLTELHRIREEGGEVALRIGQHGFSRERLDALLRPV